jgi:hypothetical protein
VILLATQFPLTLNENNDEDIAIKITTNDPEDNTALDLTGDSLEVFLKVSAGTSDTDPSSFKGSTGTGEITITDAVNGRATVSLPHTAVVTTMKWWRVDVIDSGGLRKTAVFGSVTVIDL